MCNNKFVFFENLLIDKKDRIIILDIDGTLVADARDCCDAEVLKQINQIAKNNMIYLSTNSRNEKRNTIIGATLNLPFTDLSHKKPNRKVVNNLLNLNKKFLVIGDKFLTDFVFAYNIGAECILVKRKLSGEERLVIKLINLIDDISYFIYKWCLSSSLWKHKKNI